MEEIAVIATGFIIIFVSLAFLIYGIKTSRKQKKLKNNGVSVSATVTGKDTSYGGKYTKYLFFITYNYEGKRYEAELSVTVDEYGYYMTGGQMPVMFLPEKPEKCYPESYMSKRAAIGIYVVSVFFLLIGLYYFGMWFLYS